MAFVVAYNSGGPASVMGHSSGEIHVENSTGSIVSLQELIDQGGIGGVDFNTYDSGWFSVSKNPKTYVKDHNLGSKDLLTTVYFSTSPTGDSNVYVAEARTWAQCEGIQILDVTDTQFTLQVGCKPGAKTKSDGGMTLYTSGYARIIAVKVI